jgi:DNA-directed RNA polymerase subunit M/transcription elongation factor TFIIS
MTADEMANERIRKIRRSINEELKDEHLMEDSIVQKSTIYTCPNCMCCDATLRTSFERHLGAIDPIEITLMTCNKCEHQWKTME